MARIPIPRVVFKLGGEKVHSVTLWQTDALPKKGDKVRLPNGRTRVAEQPVYVYGRRGLLRIEINLKKGRHDGPR